MNLDNHHKFYNNLLCNYKYYLYNDSYTDKIYNKMNRLNKNKLLKLIKEFDIDFNFTESNSKHDIVISVFEYYKLKYECWLIYKYLLDYSIQRIGKKSIVNKKSCSNITLINKLLKNIPNFFLDSIPRDNLLQRIDYYLSESDKKKSNKCEMLVIVGINYIDIINKLFSNFNLLYDEIFVNINNEKKKIYKDKPLTFTKLRKIYNDVKNIFLNEIIKNEINRLILC